MADTAMAKRLGTHAERLRAVRALLSVKGRREQQRFAFEGATLLSEAVEAGFPIAELYATQEAYDSTARVRELDAAGTPAFIVEEAAAKSLSDVESPSGIVGVAPIRVVPALTLFRLGTPLLVLADLNDPANAGMLLRSADAFGAAGAVFGRLGVDPYHPKVVRGAMGAIFRLPVAIADPAEVSRAADAAAVSLVGLAASGTPLIDAVNLSSLALVVGHEKRGLGRWKSLCESIVAIPMTGRSESLSAAVAGSIALYEAQRSRLVK
jgi:TrmH family RNA methyltransferase